MEHNEHVLCKSKVIMVPYITKFTNKMTEKILCLSKQPSKMLPFPMQSISQNSKLACNSLLDLQISLPVFPFFSALLP